MTLCVLKDRRTLGCIVRAVLPAKCCYFRKNFTLQNVKCWHKYWSGCFCFARLLHFLGVKLEFATLRISEKIEFIKHCHPLEGRGDAGDSPWNASLLHGLGAPKIRCMTQLAPVQRRTIFNRKLAPFTAGSIFKMRCTQKQSPAGDLRWPSTAQLTSRTDRFGRQLGVPTAVL